METENLWRKVADMILMTIKYPMINIAIKRTLEENGELINSVYMYTEDDDEKCDRTLLMIACMHYDTKCSSETVTMLLKLSNVNQQRNDGCTVLHLAAYYRDIKKTMTSLIELLIKNGADINLKDKCGDTSMHATIECYEQSNDRSLTDSFIKDTVFLVNTLLDHGGDPFIVNNKGISPYMNIYVHLDYDSPNPELLMLIKRMDEIRISEIIRDVENRQRISEIIKTDELTSGTIMGFRWV